MDMDEDGPDLYNPKMANPDSVFDTDTGVNFIPGGNQAECISTPQSSTLR